jgi:hypothetical protein
MPEESRQLEQAIQNEIQACEERMKEIREAAKHTDELFKRIDLLDKAEDLNTKKRAVEISLSEVQRAGEQEEKDPGEDLERARRELRASLDSL